ncbi:MAG: UxaA family hydrolase [Chloroflexota bacterium]
MAEQALVLDPRDSVAVALSDLSAGERCSLLVGESTVKVELREKIPFGHKFALVRIPSGENVLKYGEVIGEAIADIEPGAWVHVHNLASRRGRERSSAGVWK